MHRRTGSSLVEVLVAIFVMGLGLIALLTLFPIGMLRMMNAIHHDQCALAAHTAHTNSLLYNIRLDPAVIGDPGIPPFVAPIPDLFVNPNPTGPAALRPAEPFTESYAIFVDPIGYTNAVGTQRDWVGTGGGPSPGFLRRRDVSYPAAMAPNIFQFKTFTLGDNLKFENAFDPATRNPPGTPYQVVPGSTNSIREVRYSWAYLLRRPQASNPSIVDCTVVVFDARDPSLLLEYVYPQANCYYDPVKSTIMIDYTTNIPPPVRPGGWLLDATIAQSATHGTQNAFFYRVVATEELVIAGPRTLVRYEVAGPLRGINNMVPVVDPTNPSNTVYQGTTIVLDGVAEVYEKGPGVRVP